MTRPACKDCGSTRRAMAGPGPRCATCWRAERKRRAAAGHDKMTQRVYGLPPGAYAALLAAQGGVCAICLVANGKTKRLAVDHDHRTGEPRGCLCGPCNQMIGRLGPEALARALVYLDQPPARAVLTRLDG